MPTNNNGMQEEGTCGQNLCQRSQSHFSTKRWHQSKSTRKTVATQRKINGFESANSALEIAENMTSILEEHIGSNEEKTKAEHLLQMATLRGGEDLPESEMAHMQKQIQTPTTALTTLTHKTADNSSNNSSRGEVYTGGCSGYSTNEVGESNKENDRHRNHKNREQDVGKVW